MTAEPGHSLPEPPTPRDSLDTSPDHTTVTPEPTSHGELAGSAGSSSDAMRCSTPPFPFKSTSPPTLFRPRNQLLGGPKMRAGMQLLLEAFAYAHNTKKDAAEFAVEVAALRAVGLNHSDLRWLICKGYVQHADETTSSDDDKRTFREAANLAFSNATCFVLSGKGAAAAKYVIAPFGKRPSQSGLPYWDGAAHELRFHGRLVKRYQRPSPNQEMILAAFQEEGWPPRIDDPLPPCDDQEPRQRLRDAIKNLNRNQRYGLIRFFGDGTGQGIRWCEIRDCAPIDRGRSRKNPV